jgi:hypothetical protein
MMARGGKMASKPATSLRSTNGNAKLSSIGDFKNANDSGEDRG